MYVYSGCLLDTRMYICMYVRSVWTWGLWEHIAIWFWSARGSTKSSRETNVLIEESMGRLIYICIYVDHVCKCVCMYVCMYVMCVANWLLRPLKQSVHQPFQHWTGRKLCWLTKMQQYQEIYTRWLPVITFHKQSAFLVLNSKRQEVNTKYCWHWEDLITLLLERGTCAHQENIFI